MLHVRRFDDDIARPGRETSTRRRFLVIPLHDEAEAQIVVLVPVEYFQADTVIPSRYGKS
jgi:hypothetical protein